MQIETFQTSLQLNRYQISSDCNLSDFDLPSLIATMKESYSWANGELNSLILLKSPDEQILLTAMHEGTEIESFQSNDSVTFQIIEGKLKFHILKDSITIKKDQLMTLKEHIKYRLTSLEETIFLLTISNGITGAAGN
jgi:quercetin dioxygenase-like cupin family protein